MAKLQHRFQVCEGAGTQVPLSLPERLQSKDYIEEIDFQEPFFAVVNWPISEFYGASVSAMHYFDQTATNQLANVFLMVGCEFL